MTTIPNYISRIAKIKKEVAILQKESFKAAPGGTHHKVFISDGYVVRFRDNNPKLLLRETNFLKQLNCPLMPKVLWVGEIDNSIAMVENRLPGKTINLAWKTLSKTSQRNIIKQIVEFIQYLKTQTNEHVYSVNTDKKYNKFLDYITDGMRKKIARIKKFKQANKTLEELLLIIEKAKVGDPFSTKGKMTLVHGDLINHNLLTDGKNLTGVIDWELALWGDPNYDLFRLFYYQECACAYQEQKIDETFEADYMNKLIAAILKTNLIENKEIIFE